MGKILEVKNLTVHIKTHKGVVQAVRGVDFYLNEQETLAVVGESGSGKSITMKGVMGILPKNGKVVEGSVMFQGNDLTKYSERQMQQVRGSEIAMIFQDPMSALNPVMTVGAQIMEVLKIHHPEQSTAQLEARVDEMMELVGIPAKRKVEYPHQFSGGMKQRIVIAIALACEPKLILADEPTTALDVTIQAQMLGLINELQKRLNTAMILITHDLELALLTADRVIVLYGGRVVEETDAAAFQDEKNLKHPYTKALFRSMPKNWEKDGEQLCDTGEILDTMRKEYGR